MMDVPVEMVLGEIINNPYMVKVVVVHLLRPAHLDEITRLIPQFERISPVDNEMPALTILKVWQSKAIMDSIASTARAKFISVKRVCPTENLE
jgi:hypothetical protein